MRIITSLTDKIPDLKPAILTVGNFDGIHLGHRAVLERLGILAKNQNGHSVVLTFSNHPSEVLRPGEKVLRLCTPKHKLRLLEELGIDAVILLVFSKEFSEQTAELFLKKLHDAIQFQHLVLGHDAVMGKDRQGNPQKIRDLAKKNHFQVEYISPVEIEGIPVSSSLIRQFVQKGEFASAEKMLGRKFSIYSTVETGGGKGKSIGFPTANIETEGLCLPPMGVYAVKVRYAGRELSGVANLGYAPTVRHDHKAILEVHLFEHDADIYGEEVEVIFYHFIREEKKFPNLEHLKHQIEHDIKTAKTLLLLKSE